MKLTHEVRGTKHRIALFSGVEHGRTGAWAQLTEPAVLALSPRERIVMVTEWSKSAAFPAPSRAYIVREYELPPPEIRTPLAKEA